jgi:DHA1 family bicyclomycin/chloramphenicol resistance-like MFS transporter
VLVILGALSAFAPLSIDMYLPALPSLARGFGIGASQAQLTLSACLLGLAAGQLIAGPLSDVLGRRRPLLVGVAAYALASLLCVVAPSAGALVVLRFVQGLAGAAGIVIARAMVRDMYAGIAAARIFSMLMLVSGLAPILAPTLGGLILRVTSWRGVFVVLACIGIALLVSTAVGLGETMPPEERRTGGLSAMFEVLGELLRDRAFVGYALASGSASAAMFAYISGSTFVLQDIYGVSPQVFGLLFGINALGIMGAGQLNARLVYHVPLRRLLFGGLSVIAVGGLGLLAVIATDRLGLAGVLPALFLVVATQGIVGPTATALALTGHRSTAGSASALLGSLQMLVGAIAAPIVGLGGASTAMPMALVIAVCSVLALAAAVALGCVDTGWLAARRHA